ncbi:MAG: SDR family oxidoreductase [Streptosporangiaceae bacterium]|nr:SDR family oxidoreductase [Streptosporangiaceae bacterium]
MTGRLAGKVAVVTGGASGIGAGTVRRLIADGASVVIADVQGDAAAKLAAESGARCRSIATDVSSEPDVAAAVDLAVAGFGRLDVMFANAGIFGAYGPIEKARMADVDLTWAVDLRGVFLAMKHAARVMIPRGSGVIIATTSPAAVVGGIGNHAYSAAKAGILGLMRSVAAELREHGIRVNAVMPGAVVSAMTADLVLGEASAISRVTEALAKGAPRNRPGLPDDIAAAVSFLVSDDAAFITGHTMVVDGGLTTIGGDSPFAKGKYATPGAFLEAGRRRT